MIFEKRYLWTLHGRVYYFHTLLANLTKSNHDPSELFQILSHNILIFLNEQLLKMWYFGRDVQIFSYALHLYFILHRIQQIGKTNFTHFINTSRVVHPTVRSYIMIYSMTI